MSLPKSLLFNHSCMYAKRGGVQAYHIIWIGLCLRSVPGVRVHALATHGTIQRDVKEHAEEGTATDHHHIFCITQSP